MNHTGGWSQYNEYNDYFTKLYSSDNSAVHQKLLRNMRIALKTEVTSRQLQMMKMYYADNIKIPMIAQELGVNKSSVSRTIKRGRERLARCLRYGAAELLDT